VDCLLICCVFYSVFFLATQKKLHATPKKRYDRRHHPKPKTMASDLEDGDGDVGGNDDGVEGDVRGSDHARGGRGQRVRRRLDDSDELEYGYRRSRRRTSYENRGSSSLTPAQIMEQETYYRYAEEAVERVVFILHLVLLHQASYVALRSLVRRWSGVSAANVARSVVETARAKMKRMLDAVHHLLFVLRWIRALGEIALLHAEDLTVFIPRRQNRFGPLRCRRIDDLPYQDCYVVWSLSP
jgi:hypothetical protein